MRFFLCRSVCLGLLLGTLPAEAQQADRGFEGMWSDPPITATNIYCAGHCTDVGVEHLNALLDDPANDDPPFADLSAEARNREVEQYIRPRLKGDASESFPLDPADDPSFLYCEPYAMARQILARHQLEIRQDGNLIRMRYGEWDALRTIYLDGREAPDSALPTPLGFSVGHYEGDALVIETTAISASITRWWASHSEQLRVHERYTRTEDGERLLLTATFEDPVSMQEPIVIKKIFGWAPDEEILPYEDCERPTEFSRELGGQ